jgi:hypothetical protein
MARPTQAHLERTVKKDQPLAARQEVLGKMNYYMGAKLIEVGIDPQSPEILYRWSVKNRGNDQICTLSAFWGESKEELLSGEHPLTGEELISCAKANVSKGVETTAQLCGYGSDIRRFRNAVRETMEEMGIESESLETLIK